MTAMTHENDPADSGFAKSFVKWLAGAMVAAAFAAGLWGAEVNGRLKSLEDGQFTREEAAGLRNAIDLLRAEIVYLRADLKRVEDRR